MTQFLELILSLRDIGPHAGNWEWEGRRCLFPTVGHASALKLLWHAAGKAKGKVSVRQPMGELHPKRTPFREVAAKVAFYVLSISSRIQQSRAQASPLGALLRFQHFLHPLWKHTFSHCPQPTVRVFLPCFVQTWGGSSSKPYAGHLHEPTWFSSQPRLWDESHYPYHNKEPQAQKVPPTCIINSTQSHGIGKLAVKWSSHLVTLS